MNRRRIFGVLGVTLLLILALGITCFVLRRRNDGARYARLLSENIGNDITVVQKKINLEIKSKSEYATLNMLYASYQAICESKKKCMIQGVRMPEWAILCNTAADELTNVTYYNYEILEKNVFGIERKAYLDPNLVPVGATPEQVEAQLGLTPYRVQYLQGKTELREYRYCYSDGESGDIVSYVIMAIWDENGKLSSISDSRKNYIGTLLSSPEMN